MDPGVVLALVLLVPLLLLAFTARTRFSWLSGTLVLVAACAIFATIKPVHGDVGGIGALGNGLATIAAVGLSIFGLVLFVVGCLLGPKRERRQPSTLPVATAVAGVDKPD